MYIFFFLQKISKLHGIIEYKSSKSQSIDVAKYGNLANVMEITAYQ